MSSVVLFLLIAFALVAVALAFVLPPLLRARARREEAARAEVHADLYRRDLAEFQAEVARGELPAEELAAARVELQRRLDAARATPAAGPSRGRLAAIVLAVALPLAAGAIYLAVGRPAALDEAPAPEEGAGGADYVARLQAHLKRQPRDTRGWVLLARAQAERNDFAAAATAYAQALAAPGSKAAKDPAVLTEYADVLGMTQGGRLDGQPTELIERALAIDPRHPAALEMAGSAAYGAGRYADSVKYWSELLAQTPPATERHRQLSAAIERAQRRAAVALPR
jgi:cytochrome c-type biogenesis protein CcmH